LNFSYGDIIPKTTFGKVLIFLFSTLGICMFALPTSIFGTGLALKIQEEQFKNHLYPNPAAKLIQSFWRCYASDKTSKSIANWSFYTKSQLNQKDKQCIRFIRMVKNLLARHRFKTVLLLQSDQQISQLQNQISQRIKIIDQNERELLNTLNYLHTFEMKEIEGYVTKILTKIDFIQKQNKC
jgi:hypothetical protein